MAHLCRDRHEYLGDPTDSVRTKSRTSYADESYNRRKLQGGKIWTLRRGKTKDRVLATRMPRE